MTINATLLEFEAYIGRGSTVASSILGCSYQAYAKYRRSARHFPKYHQNHIDVIMRLSRKELARLIMEHSNGHT